jgi:hypothetical protein
VTDGPTGRLLLNQITRSSIQGAHNFSLFDSHPMIAPVNFDPLFCRPVCCQSNWMRATALSKIN